MKKYIFSLVLLLSAMTARAQDEIMVNYLGSRPGIVDFVNAILSQEDLGEALGFVADNWDRYRSGMPLGEGVTFLTDAPNGYARFDVSYEGTDRGYTEFCYWNCADGLHKVVAVNTGYTQGGKPIETETTGLDFYTYDNRARTLKYVSAYDMGAVVEASSTVTIELPRKGKDIKATIHDAQQKKYVLMKWNGSKFNQQQVQRTSGR